VVVTLRLCDIVTDCPPIEPTFTQDKVLMREGLLR